MDLIDLKSATEEIKRLREIYYFNRGVKEVPLDSALMRELAEPVVAEKNSPPVDIAGMDGFAICSSDGYLLRVSGRYICRRLKGTHPAWRGSQHRHRCLHARGC